MVPWLQTSDWTEIPATDSYQSKPETARARTHFPDIRRHKKGVGHLFYAPKPQENARKKGVGHLFCLLNFAEPVAGDGEG
jgi:hypothetical protein